MIYRPKLVIPLAKDCAAAVGEPIGIERAGGADAGAGELAGVDLIDAVEVHRFLNSAASWMFVAVM